MLSSKLGLLSLCVFAAGTMAFVAAPAHGAVNWLILNLKEETNTGGELPAELQGQVGGEWASLSTHLVKLRVEIACGFGKLIGVKLEAAGALTKGGKVKFDWCRTFNATTLRELPECGVRTPGLKFGEVASEKIKGQLQGTGEVKIEPESGVQLAKLEFEASCVLPSPTSVNGVLFVEDFEGKAATHLVEHLIKQGAGTSIFVGADNAEHLETSLIGSFVVALSGIHLVLKWGAIFP